MVLRKVSWWHHGQVVPDVNGSGLLLSKRVRPWLELFLFLHYVRVDVFTAPYLLLPMMRRSQRGERVSAHALLAQVDLPRRLAAADGDCWLLGVEERGLCRKLRLGVNLSDVVRALDDAVNVLLGAQQHFPHARRLLVEQQRVILL